MELTQILNAAEGAETADRAKIVQATYGEVHKLAAGRMSSERQDHTLTPTALAHEVSLKMLDDQQLPTASRGKFFAYVKTVMRNLLVDHARQRGRQKRGSNLRKHTFDDALVANTQQTEDLAALNEALRKLSEVDPRQAKVVQLRFYSGMSNREVAKTLGIALSTVKRDWSEAREWLLAELQTADSSAVQDMRE